MILDKDHLCTVMDIWSPRYSDKWVAPGEYVVLLSQQKVHHASPIIKINFTKAKSLLGQRFAIRRSDVEKCPLTSNGRIPCYAVNMSKLEGWETPQEQYETAMGVFDD